MNRKPKILPAAAVGIGGMVLLAYTSAFGGPKSTEGVVTDESCFPTSVEQLPIASFVPPLPAPIGTKVNGLWRTTQPYNPYIGHPQALEVENQNGDLVKIYGHNGEDLGGDHPDDPNVFERVRAPFAGKVIMSEYRGGWGNTVVIASRLNAYSNAMVTTHFHHLYERFVGADGCSTNVARGQEIGIEGATGRSDYYEHLHFTIRYWANLDHFNQWIDSGNPPGYAFLGYDAYLGHDSPDFRGSYLPGEGGVNVDSNSPYIHYGHIDPEPLFKDYFLDFDESMDYVGLLAYVKKMRYYGIELGEWNGYFGAGVPVKRREVARWIKIALGESFQGDSPGQQVFDDVLPTDPDYSYIQSLTTHPKGLDKQAIDADVSSFYPDVGVNRAEALKLIVLGFYAGEYADFWVDYEKNLNSSNPLDLQEWLYYELGEIDWTFVDFSFDEWFSSYVYFGVKKGVVALGPQNYMFRPADGVVRAEMAKWIVTGYENLHGEGLLDPCEALLCSEDQYCSPAIGLCVPSSECIPSVNDPCGQGGGPSPDCADGVCDLDENCLSCPEDCGPCPPECGDSLCNGMDDCEVCPEDCGECPVGCPDQVCGVDESCEVCPQDCGFCLPECGDNECNGDETCGTCAQDCGACPPACDDEQCNGLEDCETCPQDCGVCPPECGDGQCNGVETCNACPGDCGNCVCADGEIDQQACDPGWYCPAGSQDRVCSNDSWGAWGACEANSGLKFYGDGGKHCGPVVCLQITGSGNDSSLTATLSKADNTAFTNDVSLTIFQPSSNLTDFYGCLPTQDQASYDFQIYPDNFDIALGGTMWVNAQAVSPCVNGAYYISDDAAVSQCSTD